MSSGVIQGFQPFLTGETGVSSSGVIQGFQPYLLTLEILIFSILEFFVSTAVVSEILSFFICLLNISGLTVADF